MEKAMCFTANQEFFIWYVYGGRYFLFLSFDWSADEPHNFLQFSSFMRFCAFFLNHIVWFLTSEKNDDPFHFLLRIFFCQKATEPFIYNKVFSILKLFDISMYREREPVWECMPLSHASLISDVKKCMLEMWNAIGVVCSIPLSNFDIKSRHTHISCIVEKCSVCVWALRETEK